MSLPSSVVEGRANLLARVKLILDLLLIIALFLGGADRLWIVLLAADLLFLVVYLRFVRRNPAALTVAVLSLSAALLALAPLAAGAAGLALWVLYPLIPLGAGFVLGKRQFVWWMAAISAAMAAVATGLLVRAEGPLSWDLPAQALLLASTVTSLGLTFWLLARTLRPDRTTGDVLGEPLAVVKGVLVVPLNWVVGGVQSHALQAELHQIKRLYNPRWIVLDLAPAGELSRHDLIAIEDAAEGVATAQCGVALARPPVDALGHLDIAQPLVGRVERFATVPQAVEAGLRRLGWTQDTEQGQRIATKV